jgi:hypothetical protein
MALKILRVVVSAAGIVVEVSVAVVGSIVVEVPVAVVGSIVVEVPVAVVGSIRCWTSLGIGGLCFGSGIVARSLGSCWCCRTNERQCWAGYVVVVFRVDWVPSRRWCLLLILVTLL